jgi:putative heme iron utilization protein
LERLELFHADVPPYGAVLTVRRFPLETRRSGPHALSDRPTPSSPTSPGASLVRLAQNEPMDAHRSSSAPRSCRYLALRARYGCLATTRTTTRSGASFPFATMVALAFDEQLRPLLCLSALAEHTKNLIGSPSGSIHVAEAMLGADPLASARMTLVGTVARVPADEVGAAHSRFLVCHPEATNYVSFTDFAMWRMQVDEVWWVGGFGRMEWVTPEALAASG